MQKEIFSLAHVRFWIVLVFPSDLALARLALSLRHAECRQSSRARAVRTRTKYVYGTVRFMSMTPTFPSE
jgi:hypothetical protein